jgi:hypothetical protein
VGQPRRRASRARAPIAASFRSAGRPSLSNAHASGKRSSANVSPRLAAEPTGERGPAIEPSQPAGPSPAPAGAGVDQPQSDSPYGLVRLRRGKETRWVDPVVESGARYEQLARRMIHQLKRGQIVGAGRSSPFVGSATSEGC